jgi:formate hydrogenlyase transcriptional activator
VFRVDEAWLKSGCSETSTDAKNINGDSAHERQRIESALAASRGRISGPKGAAAKLGIPPSTLDSWIKKLNIRKDRFRLT